MDKVLVIIVTYNAHDWIHQCLNSIDMERYDAFVVDNASSDDTLQILQAEYPKAIVRAMDKNLGFGQANNIGLRYALDNGYDYVFLLNQDAWLLPDTIERLIAAQKQNPEYWVLSPLQMNTEQGGIEKQFQVYCDKNKISLDIVTPQPVDFANAAMWLMPIKCLKIVGGFDPIFPHYGEDVDYTNRVKYWQKKIGVLANVHGYHERVQGKDTLQKMQNRTQLTMLGMLLNVNYSFCATICQVIFFVARKVIKGVLSKDVVLIKAYIKAIIILMRERCNILEHRGCSRLTKAYL